MASLLEKELRSATGVKGTPTNRQEFLSALTKRLDELPDEKWEDLSKAAQEWTNKAIKEAGAGLKITDFPDITGNGKAEDDDEESEEDTTEEQDMEAATETDAETKPAPKKKKKAAAPKKEAAKKPAAKKEAAPKKKVAPKAEKKAKPPKEKKSPKIGAQAVTKQLILKNPKISVDDLLEKLKTKGFKPTRSAVSSIRSGFINSLWVIKEAGLIKIEL